MHEALDLCLSCKACKTECPVQVDMAAYKAEFLAQHYKGRVHPLQHYVFGFADKLARMGSIAPGLTNAILTGGLSSSIVKRIAGVAQPRNLPTTRRTQLSGIANCKRSAERRGAIFNAACSSYGPIPGTTITIRKLWLPAETVLAYGRVSGGNSGGTHLLRTAAL